MPIEYSCSNCKYVAEPEEGYLGKRCTRIQHINSPFNDGKVGDMLPYVVGFDITTQFLVCPTFLCKLWEPKDA